MSASKILTLCVYFVIYTLVTASLFLFLPKILAQPYLMPWDYWWVFLIITPSLVGLFLRQSVRKGQFTVTGVLGFVLAAIVLGLFYGWFSYQLSGVV